MSAAAAAPEPTTRLRLSMYSSHWFVADKITGVRPRVEDVSWAQRSAARSGKRVHARLRRAMALQTRDRRALGVRNDPGSRQPKSDVSDFGHPELAELGKIRVRLARPGHVNPRSPPRASSRRK